MKQFAKRLFAWAKNLETLAPQLEMKAAQQGAELARALAPVDSGELRRGILARRTEGGAAVVSTAPHGAMVEFGTSKSRAQPYMQPMAEKMRSAFGDMAAEAIKEVRI